MLEPDYNTIDTQGGRVALKVDLNDNWTVTPTFMGQRRRRMDFSATTRRSAPRV